MALASSGFGRGSWSPPVVKINWTEKAVVVIAAIAILTMTGPFGTYDDLRLPARIAYWTLAVAGVGLVMNLLAYFSLYLPIVQRMPWPIRMVVWVIVGAAPGALVMMGVVWVFVGVEAASGPFYRFYIKLCAISSVIALTDLRPYALAGRQSPPEPEKPSADDAEIRKFLNQLRHEIGNDIISITTQDHYLAVVTAGGEDLIYGKIGEAEKSLASLPGIRLHRSHWAAIEHIDRLRRNGSSYFAILSDGRELPVSRSNLERVRAALGLTA